MYSLWSGGEDVYDHRSSSIRRTAGDKSRSVLAVGFACGSSVGIYDDIRHRAMMEWHKGKSPWGR